MTDKEKTIKFMNTNWIYFGVFISEHSKKLNMDALYKAGVTIPDEWKMYNHHMTIAFNNKTGKAQELFNYYEDDFGKTVGLTINGIGVSDDAIAVRVEFEHPIANDVAHITIATPPDGKPVNSNNITEWIDIQRYTVSGTLTYFGKRMPNSHK